MTEEWISIKDRLPSHMETIRVFIENSFFGSFERFQNAVFLWFKGWDQGEFYDSEDQIHLDYVTKWKPIKEEKCP